MHVAICIATYRRPLLLRALLHSLADLTFVRVAKPFIRIIVVDNDSSGSARELCENTPLPWPLSYFIEPERGIARARNRSITEAQDVDFLAFIDDDEVAEQNWLDDLLKTQEKFTSHVVTGPVIPSFTVDVAKWIQAGGFFDRPRYDTGAALKSCFTNNALVSRAVFDSVGVFDDRFQLCGGEDTQFFKRASDAGHSIVWTNEAIAREEIAKDRASVSWLLHRSYQGGNSYALIEASLDSRLSTRIFRITKGCVKISQGLLTTLPAAFFGRASMMRSLRLAWLGAGMLTGTLDYRYDAYTKVSGDSL